MGIATETGRNPPISPICALRFSCAKPAAHFFGTVHEYFRQDEADQIPVSMIASATAGIEAADSPAMFIRLSSIR